MDVFKNNEKFLTSIGLELKPSYAMFSPYYADSDKFSVSLDEYGFLHIFDKETKGSKSVNIHTNILTSEHFNSIPYIEPIIDHDAIVQAVRVLIHIDDTIKLREVDKLSEACKLVAVHQFPEGKVVTQESSVGGCGFNPYPLMRRGMSAEEYNKAVDDAFAATVELVPIKYNPQAAPKKWFDGKIEGAWEDMGK